MENRGGGIKPSGTGLEPSVILCKKDYLQTGVSPRYVFDPSKKWWVFRATYGREIKAYEYLKSKEIDAYLPLQWTVKEYGCVKKRVQESLLPNILFVYCSETQADQLVHKTPQLNYLAYYTNKLEVGTDGKRNLHLTVGFDQMMNFIALTSVQDNNIRVVDTCRCRFRSGDRVRITNGAFIGIEGRVARVAGQQRVIVEVEGLCAIATAYIPSAFLEIQQ